MKRLSTRNARLIRSGLDAGKGAARLFAEYPQGRTYIQTIAIFHYDPEGDLWDRAVARSFHRWLPGFWDENEARREALNAARLRDAEIELGRLRAKSDAQAERLARQLPEKGFSFKGAGLNKRDSSVLLDGRELKGVRSVSVTAGVGEPTRVELELLVFDVTRLCSEDAEVILAPGVEESLKALGWTPPEGPEAMLDALIDADLAAGRQ